ncbi:MAG TPA: hypothetical protein VFZ00_27955 [Solirubrobacter sp.]|nr:hypothetical protein [Solirubrobacter sp.]
MHRTRLGLVLLALAFSGCGGGDEPPITPEVRAASLRFAPEVGDAERQWVLAAIDQARPEARRLIDDVDGMVTVTTWQNRNDLAVGLMTTSGNGAYTVSLNLAFLNADRKIDRNTAVLHELGHVIDHALVPPELRDQLAASLPPVGACATTLTGDCTAPEERFADTFAKWALRGAVSVAGAGYGVATPASLEDWGAPLSALAIEIAVAAGR